MLDSLPSLPMKLVSHPWSQGPGTGRQETQPPAGTQPWGSVSWRGFGRGLSRSDFWILGSHLYQPYIVITRQYLILVMNCSIATGADSWDAGCDDR